MSEYEHRDNLEYAIRDLIAELGGPKDLVNLPHVVTSLRALIQDEAKRAAGAAVEQIRKDLQR